MNNLLKAITLSAALMIGACGGGGNSSSGDQVDAQELSPVVDEKALALAASSSASSPSVGVSPSGSQFSIPLWTVICRAFQYVAASQKPEICFSVGIPLNTSGVVPFLMSKLDSDSFELVKNGKSIEDLSVRITNQYWLTLGLTEDQTRRVLAKYSTFKPLAWRDFKGLLFEASESSGPQLEALKREVGSELVQMRVRVGKNVRAAADLFARDGSPFGDGSGDNWYLDFIDIPRAWDMTTGDPSVFVGVMDAGFSNDPIHEELVGIVARNGSSNSNEEIAHGHAVASTIAGVPNNGKGVSGINWRSKLSITDYVNGKLNIDPDGLLDHYHSVYAPIENGRVRVMNNSWFRQDSISDEAEQKREICYKSYLFCPSVSEYFNYSRDLRNMAASGAGKSVLHVWAAGNNGKNAHFGAGALHLDEQFIYSPLDNVMTVAAVRSSQHLAPYSNYGKSVDIAAPTEFKAVRVGPDSYFEDARGAVYDGSVVDYGNGKGFNGTSAAAPVVTGVASLLFSRNKDLTAAQAKRILIATADRSATQRHSQDGTLEPLPTAIPILNAGKAVQSAVKTDIESVEIGGRTPSVVVDRPMYFAVRTNADTAPAQMIEISFDGTTWDTVFRQANGIRDAAGVFRSEVYEFKIPKTFSTPGDYSVFVRSTDLLDRVSTAERRFTVSPAMAVALFDDFTGPLLDTSQWSVVGSVAGYNIGGSYLTLVGETFLDTAGKVAFSGSKIVIEARMGGVEANLYLIDGDGVGSPVYMLASNTRYGGFGLNIQPGPYYNITSAAPGAILFQSDRYFIAGNGVYDTDIKFYRFTLEGSSMMLERGSDLAAMNERIVANSTTSVAGRRFTLRATTGLGGPGMFDWIRVNVTP